MHASLVVAMLLSAPALAQGDELSPVSAAALNGRAYAGRGAASEILFINVRDEPVELHWIGFDGSLKPYGEIAPGGEWPQPTFVTHRWIVTQRDGSPLAAFISTRSNAHGDGQPQIAIVR